MQYPQILLAVVTMSSIQSAPRHEWPDLNGIDTTTKEHADEAKPLPVTSRPTNSSSQHPIREALGLHETPPVHETHEGHEHQRLLWSRIRLTLREPFAELCGTAVMVFFGNGSVAQVLLGGGNKAAPGGNGYGAYQSISWG